MRPGVRILLLLACGGAVLLSCASQQKANRVEPQPVVAEPKPAEPQPQPAVAEPEPAKPEPAAQPAQEEFVVTEELYKKTFDEVEEVIAALTKIIAAREYDQWVGYLTADYVATIGSPEYLAAVSKSAVLKKNGIVLKSLKDYFDSVVVSSRSQAKLDEISFVDKTHVKAISVINDTPVILYWLVWEGDGWKVGIWLAEGD
jgi:hypothetical protein